MAVQSYQEKTKHLIEDYPSCKLGLMITQFFLPSCKCMRLLSKMPKMSSDMIELESSIISYSKANKEYSETRGRAGLAFVLV